MGVQVAATTGAVVVLVIGFDDDCRWGYWGGWRCLLTQLGWMCLKIVRGVSGGGAGGGGRTAACTRGATADILVMRASGYHFHYWK